MKNGNNPILCSSQNVKNQVGKTGGTSASKKVKSVDVSAQSVTDESSKASSTSSSKKVKSVASSSQTSKTGSSSSKQLKSIQGLSQSVMSETCKTGSNSSKTLKSVEASPQSVAQETSNFEDGSTTETSTLDENNQEENKPAKESNIKRCAQAQPVCPFFKGSTAKVTFNQSKDWYDSGPEFNAQNLPHPRTESDEWCDRLAKAIPVGKKVIFKCRKCRRPCSRRADIRRHWRHSCSLNPLHSFECLKCKPLKVVMFGKSNLIIHLQNAHFLEGDFLCTKCHDLYIDANYLRTHSIMCKPVKTQ